MRGVSRWMLRAGVSNRCLVHQYQYRRSLASVVKDASPAVQEETIRLRQYQEECIQSVLSYLHRGHKRLGISLATGAGKTVIFTQLIDRIEPQKPRADQTLILAHRRELVEQAARHCRRAYPDKSIDIEMGASHASGAADITVASVRSLLSGDRLDKYDAAGFKLVLVDEAHHIVAAGYLDILKHFSLDKLSEHSPALVGVSATFSRFDGLRLGAAIDHIVYHKDYVDMIGEKWLSDVMFTTIRSRADLSRVKAGQDGDFLPGQLSKAVNTVETNEITIKSWRSEAGDRKSTLVFCVDIAHVESLTAAFRNHGIDARYITGATRKKVRGERLEAFKKREFPVLLNCGVFTEGTDMPNIDCVLLARPTKSRNLLVQMIGRGMRLYPGKDDCHVIDMVASLETGIVTVPTLFGLDPSEMVKEASASDLKNLNERRAEGMLDVPVRIEVSNPNAGSIVGETSLDITHYDTVHDLIEDTSGERHVRSLSPNAWVQVGKDKYVLNAKGGVLTLELYTGTLPLSPFKFDSDGDDVEGHATSDAVVSSEGPLNPEDPQYQVVWKHSLPASETTKAPWSKPRAIATASTLSSAVHAADTFASKKFERIFINTNSSWRKTAASPTQLSFLNKFRDPAEMDNVDNNHDGTEPTSTTSLGLWTADDLTKGQAADMITKIKFGARGRFDRIQSRKRQLKRDADKVKKVQEMKDREIVRVGPLADR